MVYYYLFYLTEFIHLLRDNPSYLYVILKGKVIVFEKSISKQRQLQKNNLLVKRTSIQLNDKSNHENKKIIKIMDETTPKSSDRSQLNNEINQQKSPRNKQSIEKTMIFQTFQADIRYEIQQNPSSQNDLQDKSISPFSENKNVIEVGNMKKKNYSDSTIRYKLSNGNYFGDISLRNNCEKYKI